VLTRLRSGLTFANVVSSLALFIALGGGAYALTIPKNSVGAAQLKRHAVTSSKLAAHAVTSSKLAAKAVTSSKVRDGSLLAADFKPGQLPAGAKGDQGPQGARGPAGQDATKLFGYIRDFGTGDTANVEYGNGVTAVSDGAGAGTYTVTFNRDLTGCVVLAQQGIGLSPTPPTGSASTIGPAHADVELGFTSNHNQAVVTWYNGSNLVADTAFTITAFC
jgi:hypothetical protein